MKANSSLNMNSPLFTYNINDLKQVWLKQLRKRSHVTYFEMLSMKVHTKCHSTVYDMTAKWSYVIEEMSYHMTAPVWMKLCHSKNVLSDILFSCFS